MNLNNFTIKAQETIAKAQQIAYNNSNPNIETEHLLKALLDDQDSPVVYLLKRIISTLHSLKAKLMTPYQNYHVFRAQSRHNRLAATSTT